ncbi:MAG TPA: B12-binding domain-containing radical SAM protein [Pirellulales bacterium]|nr:B12-binding domain-containing radical SAM protein [Pirellulales bacterium]
MTRSVRCLLIYPEFVRASFWNFRAACEIRKASYPTGPLGLITVAALLPSDWQLRVVDCNVEQLTDADLDWADIVMTGGMLPQQSSTLGIIARARGRKKLVVVGGPDATSSPHIYAAADHLVLGEAEVTVPRWLADLAQGKALPRYEQGPERADVSRSPTPRFDLLRFRNYMYLGVQFSRGCPFLCEFCDIIELFGRVPRLKSADQILGELERLYALGHRGHVDFVDDNFIGNKRDIKKFLPRLIDWQRQRGWPFMFSTEASINLADDDELLKLMQQAGFATVFVGIESPDEETLRQTQKAQNTRRTLSDSVHKLYDHGMFVTTGYIVGFDSERGSVAPGILELIEASDTAVNMVGMLFALPGTQLARRLKREGRLPDDFAEAHGADLDDLGDQCLAGINFIPLRPRADILRDYRRVIAESYDADNYFRRVERMALRLNCSQKRLSLGLRTTLIDLAAFGRVIYRQGIKASYRRQFWRTLGAVVRRNPAALRFAIAVMALYLHFGDFSRFVLKRLDVQIAREDEVATPRAPATTDVPIAIPLEVVT